MPTSTHPTLTLSLHPTQVFGVITGVFSLGVSTSRLPFAARSVFLMLHRGLASHKDVILHHGLTVLDMMRYFHLFLFIEKLFVLLLVPRNYLSSHSEKVVGVLLSFLLPLLLY